MSLFSVIGKLAPTVGSIVGQLFSGFSSNDEVQVVRFPFNGVKPGFSADFRVVDGKCRVFNMGEEDEVISIDTPRKGGLDSQTLVIPSGNNFPIDAMFKDCAKNNVDTFGLTASKLEKDVTLESTANTTACVTLSATGYKIPTDGKSYKIGSYLKAIINGNEIIIGTNDDNKLPIVSVSSLTAQGSSDLKASVYGFDGKGQYAVPIPVACTFGKDDSVDIDVMCKLGEADKIIESSLKNPLMQKTTPEEMRLMKSAIVLNV